MEENIILKIKDLNVGYKNSNEDIIKELSMDIVKGSITLLIGPNGSGKSTLLKAVMGFTDLRIRGGIYFKDKNLNGTEKFRRNTLGIGYLLQEKNYFSNMTVEENIKISADGSKDQFQKKTDELFNLFPVLEDKRHTKAGLLSGGERQQLAIAVVLANKPELILLDEPLAGVSPKYFKDILLKITELKKLGLTIVVVEHNILSMLEIADRTYSLKDGRLVFDGKDPVEVKEKLTELFLK